MQLNSNKMQLAPSMFVFLQLAKMASQLVGYIFITKMFLI